MKKSIVLATAVAAVLTSGVAAADLSANAGVFSNYIWRGVSQTGDSAAGQGGIDWSNDGGIYAGTWVSNLGGGGYEMDVYAGIAGEAGKIGYDLGVITYQYPTTPNINFTEAYASATISAFTVGAALTIDGASDNDGIPFDSGDLYLNGSFDFAAGKSDVSVYAGAYMFDADGNAGVGDADYIHFGASVSKDGFTFAVDKNDIDDGDALDFNNNSDAVRFTASYSVDFEL
jgi:uncharacterized protein (TIGR02001 family)